MSTKRKLCAVQPIRKAVLRKQSVVALDEMVADIHSGKVTAFAIVAKADGYSRWYTWSAKRLDDHLNLVGQIEAVKAAIVEEINKD